ncbi:carbohydrate sulfotransferase [Elysia marginata]|uniref:Carbohydrate sulfotransferase n=1 Tax=Elysia marginata TaxID=1093978 RepID=A0AAV4GAF8_9GAST|nr:carbohydrate sulfotransferase [Elysia marginata]
MIALSLLESSDKEIASPFTIPITEAGRDRCDSLETLGTSDQKLAFLHNSERVVFGRDPYHRIFSAWLDKLYSPNPFYWRHWGLRARRVRGHSWCNPNVTFSQFVRLVVKPKGLYWSDVHLRPVAEECKMCKLQYTLVGKIETSTRDLDVLASRINVSMAFLHKADYGEASAIDTVLDAVEGAFSWREHIEACGVSFDRMGRSIWRKLQIRGVFDSSQVYPFKQGELDDMAPEKFTEACKIAIKNSQDRLRLKRQKEVALVQAYSQVDPMDLAKIAQIYRYDFLFFDYDKKPDKIFQNLENSHFYSSSMDKTTPKMDAFDWSKDWIL